MVPKTLTACFFVITVLGVASFGASVAYRLQKDTESADVFGVFAMVFACLDFLILLTMLLVVDCRKDADPNLEKEPINPVVDVFKAIDHTYSYVFII